jgi:hypothetical protein
MWIKGRFTGLTGKRIANRKNLVGWASDSLELSMRLS